MKKTIFIALFSFLSLASMAKGSVSQDSKHINTDSTAILKEYSGSYKMSEFFAKYVVVFKDGALYAEADSYGENKILPQKTPDVFQSTSSYGTIITFIRDEKKKVIGIKLKLMDQEVSGEKE